MSDQAPLFFEDANDALREAVRALGGTKVVGAQLWPEKSPEAAGRLLADCFNAGRPERLTLDQVMFILRASKVRGYHDPMQFICAEIGYEAKAVEPEDELVRAQREFTESVKVQARLIERMERLAGETKMRRVA